MSNADARPRGAYTIEALIQSERVKGNAFSSFALLKQANVAACADHIASAYQVRQPDRDELLRAVQLYQKRYPSSAYSTGEQAALIRAARANSMKEIPIRDVNKQVLSKMTPMERLHFMNTGGELPTRYKLLGPDDAS